MKKFTKVLSLGALATLLLGGVATLSSCGEKPVNPTSETSQPSSESSSQPASQPTTVVDTESAEDLARLIILDGIHGKTVSTNFTLPQVVGKNNTKITWVSDDTNFLTFEVDANGETVTAKITRPAADSGEDTHKVKFHAEVTVDGKTAKTKDFNVKIQRQVSKEEYFNEWVSTMGVAHDFNGYLLAKCGWTEYKGQGEATMILSDENNLGGYMVYQGYITKEEYDALQIGQYIEIKGATNQQYNGLIETKYGATITGVTGKNVEVETLRSNITTDVIKAQLTDEKGAPSSKGLAYQNTLVELDGFTVKSVEKAPTAAGKYDTTMHDVLVLERAGQIMHVAIMQGITPFANDTKKGLTDTAMKAITAETTKLKVGDTVSVKGILSWNTNATIVLTEAGQVNKSTFEETTFEKALSDVETVIKSIKSFYAKTATVDLPATGAKGSTLTYSIKGDGATISENKLTITPVEAEKKATLSIKAVFGDEEVNVDVEITSQSLSDEDIIKNVLAQFKDEKLEGVGTKEYPASDDLYNTTITYSVPGNNNIKFIEPGKLLYIPSTENKTATMTVTVTSGDKSNSKEVTLSLDKYELTDITKLGKGEGTEGAFYFAEGYISQTPNNYGNTYISAAKDTAKTLQIYGAYLPTGEAFAKWDSKDKEQYRVGAKIVVYGEYVAKYKELKNVIVFDLHLSNEDAALAQLASAKALFDKAYDATKEITLPNGVTAVVTSGTSASVDGNKVTITPTATEDTIKLKLTSTYNDATKEEVVEFKTQLPSSEATTVTLKCEVTEKVQTVANSNYAATLGLDETKFSVTFIQGTYKTNAVFNTGKYIQLYAGNSMVITALDGSKIKKLEFTFGEKEGTLTIDKQNVQDGSIVVDGSSITIASTGAGQSQIKTIKITLE
jgi:hypothetical protein